MSYHAHDLIILFEALYKSVTTKQCDTSGWVCLPPPQGFIEDVDNPPDIWAYHSFSALVRETLVIGPKLLRGVAYQMGARLDPKYVINSGLGPGLHMDTSKAIASLEPNRLVCSEEEEVFLWAANLTLTFIHIPGETEDQMAVWLPNKRVLLPADDLYKTFPNLYAVRGTPPRNSMTWHNSLKRMRDLGAEYLVPSHTQPVVGRQWIHDTLTTYMAAIRYVHDQTVRHMNRGLHPDEVASRVKRLPPSLASLPYLQQFYGTTVWSSKGVFENYVGWFSGDPVDLLPLGPTERSRRMVSMMGVDGLLAEAKVALEEGELQWALETVSHVYRIQPEMRAAQDLRWKVLRKLAGQQTNPIARNFYMTTILSDHGLIDWTIDQSPLIESLPVDELFDLMRYKVKAEVVDGVNLTIVIRFKDTRESYRLRLCHSVLEVEMLSMETISAAEAAGWTGKVTEGGGRGTREAAGECAGAGGAAGRVGGGLGGGVAAGKVTGGVAGETRRGGGRAAPGGPRRGAPEKPGVRVRGGAISEGEDRWIEEDGAFNVRIVTESTVWRQVLAKKRSLEQCIESGEIRLDPVSDGRPKLHRFFASFDTN